MSNIYKKDFFICKREKQALFMFLMFISSIIIYTFFWGKAIADSSNLRSYVSGHMLTKSPHQKTWQEGNNSIFIKKVGYNYKIYVNGVRASSSSYYTSIDGYYQWDGNTAVFLTSYPPAGLNVAEGLVVFHKNGTVFVGSSDFSDSRAFGFGFSDPVIMKSSPKALRIRLIDSGGGMHWYYRYALSDNSLTRYETKLVHVKYRYVDVNTARPIYLRGRIIRKEGNNFGKKQYEAMLLLNPKVTFYNGSYYFPKKYTTLGLWNTKKYGMMVKQKNSWFRVNSLSPENDISFYHIRSVVKHPRSPGLYKASENY